MPGAYAHITLVNRMLERLDLSSLPVGGRRAVGKYLAYCELGAASPDYPYLAIGDADAANWANEMHYTRTGEMIHAGVVRVRAMPRPINDQTFTHANSNSPNKPPGSQHP